MLERSTREERLETRIGGIWQNPKPWLTLYCFVLRSDLNDNGFRVQQNRATDINFVHKISHQIQRSRFFILQTTFLLFSSSAFLLDQDFAGTEMLAVDVASAQCGGGGENDVVPERDFQKLPSAFSGYTLLHLSRPLILSFSKLLANCE
ncbi:hypothetical protein VNO78_26347 [Psophocarpus tetragonolobus]|uniref:Uncharacterized protein n=1 Tax=Psophocarpus tetragonolobus TaxID=3891 RepID=A0AAN9X8T3_PSOTE